MDRIGIVTFWKNNYGSSLQAFATKKYLESKGFCVDILNERYNGISRYVNYVKKSIKPLFLSFKYKGFYNYYKTNKKIVKQGKHNLSEKSSIQIDRFIKRLLTPYETSYKELKNYAHDYTTYCVIAGSDQIWNCSSGVLNPYYYLDFVPQEKRIALSASFGTSEIPKHLNSEVRKYLSNFKYISVRENEGVNIVDNLLGIKVDRLADPTLLLSKKEWIEFSEIANKRDKEFVLIHFIDTPNDIAVGYINQILENENIEVLVLGYHHSIFDNVSRIINIDGGPEEYVWLINNAKFIFTDSFHTTLFAINLETNFYVFNRQYAQLLSQNSRLDNLLDLFGYSDHLITRNGLIEELFSLELHDVTAIIEGERKRLYDYLNKVLSLKKNIDKKLELKQNDECTGCGACAAVCKKKAIIMTHDQNGFLFPYINRKLCVDCGQCITVCRKDWKCNNFFVNKKAYIAYDSNEKNRNKAASGGIFSALSRYWINNGGVVYGAELTFTEGCVSIKHVEVNKIDELYRISGSKYVQSSCYEVFKQIRKHLKNNTKVLFGGTSCQIDALYRYLGERYENKLLTVDLICHGVPSEKFFQDYLNCIENKYKCLIKDFSFRLKKNKEIRYEEVIELSNNEKVLKKNIHSSNSSYYKWFLLGESYRDSCYSCQYASLSKPADITLGDYFEVSDDYPEIFNKINRENGCGISCVITHTIVGEHFFKLIDNDIVSYNIDLRIAQASHQQLCRPMRYTSLRNKLLKTYREKGYSSLEKIFSRQETVRKIPRFIKYKVLRKN